MSRFKKLVLWVVVAFFLYAIFTAPDNAATIVSSGWEGIVNALRSVGEFFDALITS